MATYWLTVHRALDMSETRRCLSVVGDDSEIVVLDEELEPRAVLTVAALAESLDADDITGVLQGGRAETYPLGEMNRRGPTVDIHQFAADIAVAVGGGRVGIVHGEPTAAAIERALDAAEPLPGVDPPINTQVIYRCEPGRKKYRLPPGREGQPCPDGNGTLVRY